LGAGAGLLRRGASARPLHREEGDGPLTGRRYAARAALAPPALAPAPPFLALAGLERERARRGRAIATAGAGQLTLGPAAALLLAVRSHVVGGRRGHGRHVDAHGPAHVLDDRAIAARTPARATARGA